MRSAADQADAISRELVAVHYQAGQAIRSIDALMDAVGDIDTRENHEAYSMLYHVLELMTGARNRIDGARHQVDHIGWAAVQVDG